MRRIVTIATILVVLLVGSLLYARHSRSPQTTRTVAFEASATPSPKTVITCAGVTKKGERCKRHVRKQGDYCWQHKGQAKS